jgi:hypothetical protein
MDIVILIWGFTVAATVILGVIGILIGKLIHPQMDVSTGGETIGTIVAAMTGFIGGRKLGQLEANGQNNQ